MLNHHAQLIEGSIGHIGPVLDVLAEKYGLHRSHPDLTIKSYEHEKFGVEDAHMIHEILIKKPAQAELNVVVVYAHTLTEQAQNALLKILEEPPLHTRFILITDSIHPLLPTLRSRLNLLTLEASHLDKSIPDNPLLDADRFLAVGVSERLEIVKKIHTDLDKEHIGIADVFAFVNSLETRIQHMIQSQIVDHDGNGFDMSSLHQKLGACVQVQTYMHAPGNSVKMLLEHLAISI